MTILKKILLALIIATFVLPMSQALAQIHQIEQTVFGMDCAPCAYSLEKRLKGLTGVSEAHVSLNDGVAQIELEKGNDVTLGAIRDAVHKSGFSAEESEFRASGFLEMDGNGWIFRLPAGEKFEVRLPARTEIETLRQGRATITARVDKTDPDEGDAFRLVLLSVDTS